MFNIQKKRHQLTGTNIAQAHRNQAELLFNETFCNDPAYMIAYINDKPVDIHYYRHIAVSISADRVDYYVQFRPHVKYPLGTYIDIPDEDDQLNRWLIVDTNDLKQFRQYNVLKCNWTFKWIYKNELYECLGCVRSRNSYNSGVWTDEISTSPENQIAAWLPTNDVVRTIDYDYRMVITDNLLHPCVYSVTKIENVTPKGITKVTFKQCDKNEHIDNYDDLIASFYDMNIEPKPYKPNLDKHILYLGNSPHIKCGGSIKKFWIDDNDVTWEVIVPEDKKEFINYNIDDNALYISSSSDIRAIGTVIKIHAYLSDNTFAFQEIEVVSL